VGELDVELAQAPPRLAAQPLSVYPGAARSKAPILVALRGPRIDAG
jgi:hypothetical protein